MDSRVNLKSTSALKTSYSCPWGKKNKTKNNLIKSLYNIKQTMIMPFCREEALVFIYYIHQLKGGNTVVQAKDLSPWSRVAEDLSDTLFSLACEFNREYFNFVNTHRRLASSNFRGFFPKHLCAVKIKHLLSHTVK